jgi:hypothetical protein
LSEFVLLTPWKASHPLEGKEIRFFYIYRAAERPVSPFTDDRRLPGAGIQQSLMLCRALHLSDPQQTKQKSKPDS